MKIKSLKTKKCFDKWFFNLKNITIDALKCFNFIYIKKIKYKCVCESILKIDRIFYIIYHLFLLIFLISFLIFSLFFINQIPLFFTLFLAYFYSSFYFYLLYFFSLYQTGHNIVITCVHVFGDSIFIESLRV